MKRADSLVGFVFAAVLTGAVALAGCSGGGGGDGACGDGEPVLPETCDDGNTVDGDGCSATCAVEAGFTCWGTPSHCASSCGDGMIAVGEQCDDGNSAFMDGCGADCTVEHGFECSGEPSVCVPICGDGSVQAAEACDDGNTADGDGCSSACIIEDGYECPGIPSQCHGVCGNGGMTPDEACDDGNTTDGDGCAADCTVEAGWDCDGTPSSCHGTCGDGIAVGTEPCDGGGESATCNDDCTVAACGDSKHNATAGEDCDDGGESATCDDNCTYVSCGDGTVNGAAGEICDDGGTAVGDGCDDSCLVETAYACTGEPSICTVDCGDGIVYGGEQCDDSGESATCDANCTFVSCGDGDLNHTAGETCDDGNNVSDDGCDATCQSEYVLYVDPVAEGHTVVYDGSVTTYDDYETDVSLPFAFPHWETATATGMTSTVGFSTNGGLVLGAGSEVDCCSQPPLWTYEEYYFYYSTIHAHGEDGYVDTPGRMYSYTDATMAVFTWMNMDYCCTTAGNWSVQVVLYPNGNFSIYQIAATTNTMDDITIGLSDGDMVDNSTAGSTNLNWDTQTIGTPFGVGQVDFGSSLVGGMATGRHLLFEFNDTTGYTCTVTQ